ncbi:versicolorin b synthase [Paraphaeosphaeria minitans]|uniref:Versicolorin b synthase n=1 Tax=Paraphaeosphaeria minitans TaxID=565426 RepID=A0A9P6GG37_9PLEO|nr:versicolorin b synthase [Paraphaeosphaeria minitans]
MGKEDDMNAVVDSKAQVSRVSGLRVVDTSSFALLPPWHPQSTIHALAEKTVNDIKAAN